MMVADKGAEHEPASLWNPLEDVEALNCCSN